MDRNPRRLLIATRTIALVGIAAALAAAAGGLGPWETWTRMDPGSRSGPGVGGTKAVVFGVVAAVLLLPVRLNGWRAVGAASIGAGLTVWAAIRIADIEPCCTTLDPEPAWGLWLVLGGGIATGLAGLLLCGVLGWRRRSPRPA